MVMQSIPFTLLVLLVFLLLLVLQAACCKYARVSDTTVVQLVKNSLLNTISSNKVLSFYVDADRAFNQPAAWVNLHMTQNVIYFLAYYLGSHFREWTPLEYQMFHTLKSVCVSEQWCVCAL